MLLVSFRQERQKNQVRRVRYFYRTRDYQFFVLGEASCKVSVLFGTLRDWNNLI